MQKAIKNILLLVSTFFFSLTVVHGQIDSTDKYVFNWQIATGAMQSNFSALHKYDYLLNRPANINFNYPSLVFFIGNPKKFFVTIPWGIAFNGQRKGTYNGYNISADGGLSYLGLDLSFPLKTHFDRKGLQAIYLSFGGQFIGATISSGAKGINPQMHDTTFYYEASRANNIVANVELMFEFSKFGKRPYPGARIPIVFTIGYNLQFQKPRWYGTYYRNVGDENPNVNSGGFYFRIGFNIWTTKRFWKGMSAANKKLKS